MGFRVPASLQTNDGLTKAVVFLGAKCKITSSSFSGLKSTGICIPVEKATMPKPERAFFPPVSHTHALVMD